jgi:hypothetical protein
MLKRDSTGPYPELDELSSYPHTVSLRLILILSLNIRKCLPSGLFSLEFPTEMLYALISREFVSELLDETYVGQELKSHIFQASIMGMALVLEPFTPEKAPGKRMKIKIRNATA